MTTAPPSTAHIPFPLNALERCRHPRTPHQPPPLTGAFLARTIPPPRPAAAPSEQSIVAVKAGAQDLHRLDGEDQLLKPQHVVHVDAPDGQNLHWP